MPVTAANTLQFYWKDASVPGCFRSGVSLHSHTLFSEESLDIVPRYTARVPYLGSAIARQQAEYNLRTGQHLEFRHAFWTPPLAPRQANRLEEKQIQRKFQLPAVVSLTDHDDSRAASLLRVLHRFRDVPVSTEWTVPFGPTFFHLGIHNMPPERAEQMQADFARLTAIPNPKDLAGYLEALQSCRDLLVVLNHPLWDEKGIGREAHRQILSELLRRYRNWVHALELNGLRSWRENKDVITLGRQLNLPVISGGDRHGREPNAILNLTEGFSFSEFVNEIRQERRSHVVFMPQYREPIRLRVLQTIVDVIRDYPENVEGRRMWCDRVFYRDPLTGNTLPLREIWKDGGPTVAQHFLGAMNFLECRAVRTALRLALDDRSEIWSDGEVSA